MEKSGKGTVVLKLLEVIKEQEELIGYYKEKVERCTDLYKESIEGKEAEIRKRGWYPWVSDKVYDEYMYMKSIASSPIVEVSDDNKGLKASCDELTKENDKLRKVARELNDQAMEFRSDIDGLRKLNESLQRNCELLVNSNESLRKGLEEYQAIVEVLYRIRAWYYGMDCVADKTDLMFSSLGIEVVSQLFEGVMNGEEVNGVLGEPAQKEEKVEVLGKAEDLPLYNHGKINVTYMSIPEVVSKLDWYQREKAKFIDYNGLDEGVGDDKMLMLLSNEYSGNYADNEPICLRMFSNEVDQWMEMWKSNPNRGEVMYPVKLVLKGVSYK